MSAHDDALSDLGAALAEVRQAHHRSLADVIERLDPKLSRQLHNSGDLELIERGELEPSFLTLVAIARAIGVPLVDVFIALDRRRE